MGFAQVASEYSASQSHNAQNLTILSLLRIARMRDMESELYAVHNHHRLEFLTCDYQCRAYNAPLNCRT